MNILSLDLFPAHCKSFSQFYLFIFGHYFSMRYRGLANIYLGSHKTQSASYFIASPLSYTCLLELILIFQQYWFHISSHIVILFSHFSVRHFIIIHWFHYLLIFYFFWYLLSPLRGSKKLLQGFNMPQIVYHSNWKGFDFERSWLHLHLLLILYFASIYLILYSVLSILFKNFNSFDDSLLIYLHTCLPHLGILL